MSTLADVILRDTAANRPAAGTAGRLFYDTTNGKLQRDNGATWDDVAETASGSVATDAIWDAAGDLAVGSGANTAARLAKGAAGAYLSTFNGSVAWNGGTSFPASPATGDRYWRSDLGMEFYYDGTRWVSVQVFEHHASVVSAAASANSAFFPMFGGASDIWVVDMRWAYRVTSTHSGTQYWQLVLNKQEGTGSVETALATIDTNKSSTIYVNPAATAIGAVVASSIEVMYFSFLKVSTPGVLSAGAVMRYRLIAT